MTTPDPLVFDPPLSPGASVIVSPDGKWIVGPSASTIETGAGDATHNPVQAAPIAACTGGILEVETTFQDGSTGYYTVVCLPPSLQVTFLGQQAAAILAILADPPPSS